MLVTEIEKYLTQFIKPENEVSSVLINGKWGCGKTYNINLFVNKHEMNYIYLSLFGVSSINDLVIRLSEKIDSSYIININNHYYISNLCDKNTFNGGIIIFDDIERKSSGLKFSEICGTITALKMNGFKIISLVSLDELQDENYMAFMEKTFDREIEVISDPAPMKEILGDSISLEDSFLKTANGNYRLIIKAKTIMDEIYFFFSEKKDLKPLIRCFDNQRTFMRCIIIALRCKYWSDAKEPIFGNEHPEYKQVVYESNKIKYGVLVANGLNYFFFNNEAKENHSLLDDVRLLLDYFIYSNDCLFCEEDKLDILDSSPFCDDIYYLDDGEKIRYKKELLSRINEFDFSKENHLKLLLDVLHYSVKQFTDKELSSIVNRIVDSYDKGKNELSIYLRDYVFMSGAVKEMKNVERLIELLDERFENKESSNIKKELTVLFKQKDYNKLIDFLYKFKNELKTDEIVNIFSKVDYLIPDLSKSINHAKWTYCHEIARFVLPFEEHRNKFINILVEQCKKSKSISLRDRCQALLKYNFNLDFNAILQNELNKS